MQAPDPIPPTGPVRDGLVRLGLAVTAAALLKWTCLEAYRIPTPSMQPTLLGCVESDTHDHVLVDKLHYLTSPLARWDLAAFRAPLQQRDVFAKRVVGLPGDRVMIAGGNLYLARGSAASPTYQPLRRPPALQAAHWREIHPARAEARGDSPTLASTWRATPAAAWRDAESGLEVALSSPGTATLTWADPDGGLVDRLWDGHPATVAIRLRSAHASASHLGEIVPDAKVALQLTTSGPIDVFRMTLDVRRPNESTLRFGWEWHRGRARLVVLRDGEIVASSPPRELALPSTGTRLSFAHIDDELIAWADDAEVARLDTTQFPCHTGCELPDPCGMGPAMPLPEQRVDVGIELTGAGTANLQDIRIWRDQHWTRGPLAAGTCITVPAGHFFALGDNPLQSEDGRGWRSFEAGELAGALVPATTAGARLIRGSRHEGQQDLPPARDENPVFLPDRGLLILRDDCGEVTTLRTANHQTDGIDGPLVQFVPMDHLVGRAMLRFWPLPPFGPLRVGWLR
jgi:signal peptidase I